MIGSRPEMLRIIEEARSDGWVLEPAAKRFFSLAGFSVPRFTLARTPATSPVTTLMNLPEDRYGIRWCRNLSFSAAETFSMILLLFSIQLIF